MAFDKAGNLYVTNFTAGAVTRFDQGGNRLGTFGSGYERQRDVFRRVLATGVTTLVSVSGSGTLGTKASTDPTLSTDGTRVGFSSTATNLVSGDTNNRSDTFIRDTGAGTTTRWSVATDGTQGNDTSENPCLTADGGTIAFQSLAFQSLATNLVAGDTNGTNDVFVWGPGLQ